MFRDDLATKMKEDHTSQKDLAEYLSCSQSAVSRWLSGDAFPAGRNFDMICELYELSRERYIEEKVEFRSHKRKTEEPKEEPKVQAVFTPTVYVDPKVVEKQQKLQEPTDKDKVKENLEKLKYRPQEHGHRAMNNCDHIASLAKNTGKCMKDIEELNKRITELREEMYTQIHYLEKELCEEVLCFVVPQEQTASAATAARIIVFFITVFVLIGLITNMD